jgi:hypothetical protein
MSDDADKLAIYQPQAATLLEASRALDITTPDGEARAETWLIEGREFCKRMDAELVDPWRKVKREADANMKRLTDSIINPVMAVVNTLKDRIAKQRAERQRIADEAAKQYQDELDAKAKREQAAALKAADKLKTPELRAERRAAAEGIVAPIVTAASAKPAGTKLVMVVTWGFEIADAAMVPREYLMPDESKIGAVIRASKGTIQIPGVRAIRRESVR